MRASEVRAWAEMRVALLSEVGFEAPGGNSPDLQASIESWLRWRLLSPGFAAFVAGVGGELVGSGGVSIYDVPPGTTAGAREGYVMSMYTIPAYRGRGVARAILAGLIDFARSCEVGRVWLRASAMGRPGYEKAGFQDYDRYMHLDLRGK